MVDGDAACGIYRQRAVVDIVPPSVAEGACRKGLLSFAAVEFQRRRSGNELRFGPLVPDECEVSGHRGGAADAVLPNVVVHGRFGGDDEICIGRRGGCEGQDNGVLFLLRERELFGIGLYVGLDGGHRHPLSGRLLPTPEEDERQEDGKRRPGRFAQPPHFPAGCQRPDYQTAGIGCRSGFRSAGFVAGEGAVCTEAVSGSRVCGKNVSPATCSAVTYPGLSERKPLRLLFRILLPVGTV